MMKLNAEHVLKDIVETMLPEFSPTDLGLIIGLDLRDSYYCLNSDNDMKATSSAILLFQRPSRATKVLEIYEFDNGIISFWDLGTNYDRNYFKLRANHDSAWHTDGFMFMNEHEKNIERYFEENGVDKREINRFYTISSFCPINYVRINSMEPVCSERDRNLIMGYYIDISKHSEFGTANEISEFINKEQD